MVDRSGEAARRSSMVVLLVAAKKSTIAEYAAAVAQAGCVPAVVDVAAFALQNAYVMYGGFDESGLVALLNAGASTINVNIVRGGRSVFTRDIAAGGNACTEALSSACALSFEEAERLKKGLAVRGGAPRGGRAGAAGSDRGPAARSREDLRLLRGESGAGTHRPNRAERRRVARSGIRGGDGPTLRRAPEAVRSLSDDDGRRRGSRCRWAGSTSRRRRASPRGSPCAARGDR